MPSMITTGRGRETPSHTGTHLADVAGDGPVFGMHFPVHSCPQREVPHRPSTSSVPPGTSMCVQLRRRLRSLKQKLWG